MNLRPSFRSLGRLVSTALLMVSCGAATMQAQAPTTAVGNTSAVQTATVTITTAGTLSKIAVLTQGATGLDYQAVTNGALLPCMVGVPYLVNETCTVQYTFSPTHPWVRYGGISLSSSSGALLGNLYLTGSGTAPQVSYPAGPTTVPATLTSAGNPNSVAVDGSGNLYFADAASGSVKEAAAVGGVVSPGAMISTVATGFTSPNAIAVDGSGNVFVLESGGAVKEIVATSGTVRTLATGFGAPLGIAVDASGDIFVTDTTAGSVREIAATNGVISATPAITTVTTAHVNPSGVAVDLAGDVFFTDSNLVKEIPSGGTVQTVATLAGANGLAVDVAGDLYVSDTANKAVYEILAVAGVIPASPTVVTLGTGFVGPNGLAVDAGGNVFVADMAGTPGFLKELNVSTPPTITFTSTAANTPSSDSPMTLTVGNNGTDPLVFAIPTTGTNPSPSAGFTVTAGPTITGGPTTRPATPCPQLTTASATTLSLAAGAACTDNISFDPAAIGAVTGTLTSTDNNLNATATQVVPLNGGLASPTITVTSTSAAVDTTSVTLTAVIAYNGLTPGGTFGFTVNGSATGVSGPNCEPTAGSTTTCTATLNAATAGLAVGTYPIVANLGADPSNNAATGSGTLTITIGTPVVSVGTSNASVAVDSPVTFTATVSPITGVTPTGAVSFTSTVGGVTTQIAGCGITSPVGINIATHMAACTTSALPAGSYTITANYGGDTNFNAASGTLAGTQTITLATPAVVLTTSNNSVVVNTPIIFTAAVTPTGGNVPSGKVSFSSTLAGTTTPIAACSGANAVAINGATHNATCTTSALAAGSYTITATVAADSNFNSATSNSLPQTVTLGTPVLTLPATGTPSLVNGPVSFTALVSPNAAGGFVPSGKVSFSTTLNGTTTAIAACSGANAVSLTGSGATLGATCTTTALQGGSNGITATIAADSNFNTATSNTETQVVNPATPTVTVTTSGSPSIVDNSVTFTASITPNTGIVPSGKVTFTTTLSGVTTTLSCSPVTLVPGTGPTSLTATCVTTALAAGANTITATLAADTNFTTASNTVAQTVNPSNTTLTITPPVAATVDQTVTFTATLTASASFTITPGGTVAFSSNGVGITGCSAVALNATTHTAACTTSALVAPSDVITAVYSGDANFNTSTAAPVTQVITKNTPVNTITSSLASSIVNQTVTFTATITPAGASTAGTTPGGSVTFTKGGVNICAPVVVSPGSNGTGTASCAVGFTSAFASTNIVATYSSDQNFNAGNAPTVAQVVTAAPTTTTVASATNPSTVNQSVNLTATITPTNPVSATFSGTATPQSGTLSFSDSLDASGPFCSTTIAAGTPNPVTCAHVFASQGSHVITATFTSTDPNFTTSTTMNSITQQVNTSGTTSIAVTTATPAPTVDQNVTFTASFTPTVTGTQPQGTVSYFDTLNGPAAIAGCSNLTVVAGAIPSCTETMLVAGTHNISATFTTSDTNFANITSPIFSEVVAQNTTAVTLTSPTTTSVTDQVLTFTATVTPGALSPAGPGTTAPTGTVSFSYLLNGTTTPICSPTVTTTAGVTSATCNAPLTVAGSYSITATYAGDGNFKTASSTPHMQVVGKASTNVALSGPILSTPASPAVNQSATYSVQISALAPAVDTAPGSSVPTGTVVFLDAANPSATCTAVVQTSGLASCSFSDPASGTRNITVNYSGDANFSVSTASLSETYGASGVTVSGVGANPASPAVNQAATLVATVTAGNGGTTIPSGTVTFTDHATGIPDTTCVSTLTLTGAVPPCAHTFTSSGPHTITAAYSGDANFAANSAQATVTVTTANTTNITVSTTTPSPIVDQNATFTAVFTPTPTGAQPQGTVSYYDSVLGASPISTCTNLTVAAGVIPNCVETMFVAGTHNVSAVFTTGDTNFQNISSPLFAEVVAQNSTSVALTSPTTTTSVTDQILTFTATVTPAALTPTGPGNTVPTGTVSFSYVLNGGAATPICNPTVTTTAGVTSATCNAPLTVAGSYSITATYLGDTNFKTATSGAHAQTVTKEATNIALSGASLSSPASPAVNQSAVYTVQLSLAGGISDSGLTVPTGTVVFVDAANPSATCTAVVQASGLASCSFADPASGTRNITVTYSGDANFSTSTVSLPETYGASPTSVTGVGSTPANPAVNQNTTLNATVTSTNGGTTIPTGTVTFTDHATGIPDSTCTSQISAGAVIPCAHIFVSAGQHTITAVYSGDGNFATSQGSAVISVSSAGTTSINVGTTTPSPIENQNATFTAVFTPTPVGAQPQGTISYYDTLLGASPISTCTNLTVTAGVIPNCVETMLVAGTHNISAVFTSGDQNFQNIASAFFPEVVAQNSTSVALTSPTTTTSVTDQVLTFTATVTPAPLVPAAVGTTSPTGTVAFTYILNGISKTICAPSVSTTGGVTSATCSTAAFTAAAGTYPVTATYSGDSNFKTAASAPVSETVNKEATSIGLVSGSTLTTPASPQVGSSATYSVQLSLAGGITDSGLTVPTGNVVFTDAATSATCTAVVQASGLAACQMTEPTGGTHTIAVAYSGDANFSASNQSFQTTIALATPIISLTSSGSPSIASQNVVFTATVIAPPGGNTPSNPGANNFTFAVVQGSTPFACISYTQAVTGTTDVATCTVNFPANVSGSFSATATYNGDADYTAVTSATITQVVENFTFTTAPAAAVTLAQGGTQGTSVVPNTNLSDAYFGKPITFTVAPQSGFIDTLTPSCTFVDGSGNPITVTGLVCTATLSGTSGSVLITATATGTPPSPAPALGTYTAQLTIKDNAVGLKQTANIAVTIIAQPTAVFSPAVGTTVATFTLPLSPVVAASTLSCNSAQIATSNADGTYTTSTGKNFASIGIACSAITSTTPGTYTFTITAGNPSTAKLQTVSTGIIAATFGAPFLLLFALLPAFRKQRKLLARGLAIVFLAVTILQTTGCGGGGFTHATPTQAVTGSYLIAIVNASGTTVAEVPLVIGNGGI